MGLLAFCEAVIAGLRARGWPEHGLDDNDCVVWRGIGGSILLDNDDPRPCGVNYDTADGEGGYLSFTAGVSPERVVEAIDRLRWVIGLPARVGPGNLAGCLPPLIPPEGAREALAAAREWAAKMDDLLRRTGDKAAKAAQRASGFDPDGPPSAVPLRVTPAPKEDPAYVPTQWIGAGGHRWE